MIDHLPAFSFRRFCYGTGVDDIYVRTAVPVYYSKPLHSQMLLYGGTFGKIQLAPQGFDADGFIVQVFVVHRLFECVEKRYPSR